MLPEISVIIPVRPNGAVSALAALRAADYPPERLEILVVEGEWPPTQYNRAAEQAHGEIFYFLDDDSLIEPGNLRRLAEHYRSPAMQLVGGPSLTSVDGSLLSRCIGYALGTCLGAWQMRARYAPVGACRPAGEKEVIGCNLSIRRAAFEQLGGFCEGQYPNNETDLVSRWRVQGGMVLYDPEFVVWRTQRQSLAALAQQFCFYGRGRMCQMRRAAWRGSPIFLLPVFGLIYLILLALLGWFLAPWIFLPLGAYLGLILATSLYLAMTYRCPAAGLLLPLIFVIIHAAYACGLIVEMVVAHRVVEIDAKKNYPVVGVFPCKNLEK